MKGEAGYRTKEISLRERSHFKDEPRCQIGEVIAFLVPAFLLFTGLVAASWMEPMLTGSSSAVHRLAWLALPHYHLADLTPRLVFKMGPLTQGDFLGSVTCLALQGVAITLTGLCMFRTRS